MQVVRRVMRAMMVSFDHLDIFGRQTTWSEVEGESSWSYIACCYTHKFRFARNSDLLGIQISWFVDCDYYEITIFRVLPRWRFQISRVSTISGNDSSLIASA
jgi:hypothetical protein